MPLEDPVLRGDPMRILFFFMINYGTTWGKQVKGVKEDDRQEHILAKNTEAGD